MNGLTAPVLNIEAYWRHRKDASMPCHYLFRAEFATLEQAQQFAALFPKTAKLTTVTCYDPSRGTKTGIAENYSNLTADGSNGGVNETAIRRYRTLVKAAAKLGITVAWYADPRTSNAYQTREEFERAAGITAA
ncbi:hypothetical protein Rhe02_55790 [Rhizocola hellebori]|uniref:Uncharacterized protein n=1 Tax=Rhizocola hellebori TaxID=1392758 RepID=A0A8J3VIL1_9ACTN|nr:hypothetical protein [Rhizocola hellebori]GIH07512.1 hypothetical protein Rhe02_55790 [Rhizocola hellebori]